MHCEHLLTSHHTPYYPVSTTAIKGIKFERYLYFKLFELLEIMELA